MIKVQKHKNKKKKKQEYSWEQYCFIDKPKVGHVAIVTDPRAVSRDWYNINVLNKSSSNIEKFEFYGRHGANVYFITDVVYKGHSYVNVSVLGGEKHYTIQEHKIKNRKPRWIFIPVNQLFANKEFFLVDPGLATGQKEYNAWGYEDITSIIEKNSKLNNPNLKSYAYINSRNTTIEFTWDSIAALITVCGGKLAKELRKETIILYANLYDKQNESILNASEFNRMHSMLSQRKNKKYEVYAFISYVKQQLQK